MGRNNSYCVTYLALKFGDIQGGDILLLIPMEEVHLKRDIKEGLLP